MFRAVFRGGNKDVPRCQSTLEGERHGFEGASRVNPVEFVGRCVTRGWGAGESSDVSGCSRVWQKDVRGRQSTLEDERHGFEGASRVYPLGFV